MECKTNLAGGLRNDERSNGSKDALFSPLNAMRKLQEALRSTDVFELEEAILVAERSVNTVSVPRQMAVSLRTLLEHSRDILNNHLQAREPHLKSPQQVHRDGSSKKALVVLEQTAAGFPEQPCRMETDVGLSEVLHSDVMRDMKNDVAPLETDHWEESGSSLASRSSAEAGAYNSLSVSMCSKKGVRTQPRICTTVVGSATVERAGAACRSHGKIADLNSPFNDLAEGEDVMRSAVEQEEYTNRVRYFEYALAEQAKLLARAEEFAWSSEQGDEGNIVDAHLSHCSSFTSLYFSSDSGEWDVVAASGVASPEIIPLSTNVLRGLRSDGVGPSRLRASSTPSSPFSSESSDIGMVFRWAL